MTSPRRRPSDPAVADLDDAGTTGPARRPRDARAAGAAAAKRRRTTPLDGEPGTVVVRPDAEAVRERPLEPAPEPVAAPADEPKVPLYPRLLRLRHVKPNAWQRAALGEGALGVAVLLVLADLATAWTLVALPVAVAAVVKAHDGLAGLLAAPSGPSQDPPPDA